MGILSAFRKAYGLLDSSVKPILVALLATSVVSSTIDAAGLAMVFAFFQIALRPDDFGGFGPLIALHEALGKPDPARLLAVVGALVVVAFVARSAVLMAVLWISLKARNSIQYRLSHRMLETYLAKPLVWHLENSTARLINNTGPHVAQVSLNVVVGTLLILGSFVTLAFVLATMLLLRPLETAVAAGGVAALSVAYIGAIRKTLVRWGERQAAAAERQWAAIVEPLRAIKVVKIHALESFFVRRFDRENGVLLDLILRQALARDVPQHILQIALVAAVIGTVAVSFGAGTPTADLIPTMILLTGAALRIIPVVLGILNQVQILRVTTPALDMLCADAAAGAVVEPSSGPAPAAFRSIELRGVSFGYKPGTAALKDIDLTIAAGERVALVGLSGAGKSTLAEMLLSLLEPAAGSLVLNGRELRRLPPELFAYVPQETPILMQSFARNIALGEAPIDEARLDAAVRGAALDGVLARLPMGKQTILTEHSGLSGGERQRLGIARALYREAPVIVMDEPTSALDALTEADIAATLDTLKNRRTIVLIAHRLSTIRHFDRILYMDGGRIVQQGTFDEIYAGQPQFRAMVDLLQTDMEKRPE